MHERVYDVILQTSNSYRRVHMYVMYVLMYCTILPLLTWMILTNKRINSMIFVQHFTTLATPSTNLLEGMFYLHTPIHKWVIR